VAEGIVVQVDRHCGVSLVIGAPHGGADIQ
jgi:hypothetical protein